MKKLWELFNGHKTNIGSFLITIYTFAVQLELVTYNNDVLTVLTLIFGLGVSHKAVKYIQKTS